MAAASRAARAGPIDLGEPPRRQPGAEQRLAGIDVAEAGDDALIEQCRLDRRQLAGQRRTQVRTIETGLERLRAEPGKERVLRRLAALQIVDQAKAAGVVEADDGSIVEGQDDMVVRGRRQRCAADGERGPTCRDGAAAGRRCRARSGCISRGGRARRSGRHRDAWRGPAETAAAGRAGAAPPARSGVR